MRSSRDYSEGYNYRRGYQPKGELAGDGQPPNVESCIQSQKITFEPLTVHLDLAVKLDPEVEAYIQQKIKEILNESS